MRANNKFRLLITPSATSLLFGISISIITIVVCSVSFAEHSGRFANFNLSSYANAIGVDTLGSQLRSFFSNLKFNTLFSILFWVLIGFIAYNIVYVFRSSVDESVSFIQRFHYVHAKPGYMRRQVVVRLLLLLIALILWVTFALLFSWFILPTILNLVDMTISNGRSPIFLILSLIIALLITHVATILMRFTLLKVRVTGTHEA